MVKSIARLGYWILQPLNRIISRYYRHRLRKMMRGYRRLKETNQLDRVLMLKSILAERPIFHYEVNYAKTIYGAALPNAELATRQYLLMRVAHMILSRAVLNASGTPSGLLKAPIPKEWRLMLEENGVKVSNRVCAILWFKYITLLFIHGIVKGFKQFYRFLRSKKSATFTSEAYIYFCDLSHNNLPRTNAGEQSHDIISWYLQWPERREKISSIRHSVPKAETIFINEVKISHQQTTLPDLQEWSASFKYVFWFLKASIIAALDCMRGRWWHALLLNQAVESAKIHYLPKEKLAEEYFFHNSSLMYRPLWTYEAEAKGSSFTYYFYSTNSEAIRKPDGSKSPNFGYSPMNWPRYLVWDLYQADFVRECAGRGANVQIVGPIWFHSSEERVPPHASPSIAVFDVQPFREAIYRSFALPIEYYTPRVAIGFLTDISNAINSFGGRVLWKRKRNIGRSLHPTYRKYLDCLCQQAYVVAVDPNISAVRVIESASAVVSMPFTSVAIIAQAIGKPTVYYDPTGIIRKDDPAAHGVQVISGRRELSEWVVQVLHKELI
jgi:polysaccharide biosynthesis PFTS motif protein